jgi:hypothetical protein
MGTKSREAIYGSSIRASAERAKEARKEADRLACVAWNQRMLGFQGPAQPSPALGDALQCLRVEIGPDPKRVRGRATATTWRRKLCASTSRRVDIALEALMLFGRPGPTRLAAIPSFGSIALFATTASSEESWHGTELSTGD